MMFKDKYIHKFYAFALAAVFALTLAGCGGGGGTAAMPDPEPPVVEPEPTPQEMCEGDGGRYNADGSCTSAADLAEEMALSGAQEAAMAAYMAAMAAVAGAVDPVAMANAQMYADAAMTASAGAAAATTSEMAMTHQMAAEAAQASAEMAAGERGLGLTMRANANANQDDIDSATLRGVPAPMAVPNARRVGTAIRGAVTATQIEAAAPELAGTHQGPVATARATFSGSSPTITVTATPASGTATALSRGESPISFSDGGFRGTELVLRETGATASRQHAVVFTDINPAQQQYQPTTGGTGVVAADAFAVNTGVVTGDIPGDGSSFVGTYNSNPTDNAPPVNGRFTCASSIACAISVDDSGVIRAVTGYTFNPAIARDVTRQDSDYLAWGVWLRVPDAVDAVAEVSAFANGSNVFDVVAALTGTATFAGSANGLYSAGGAVEYFSADATLTADFGGRTGVDSGATAGTPDTNLFGAVTGEISNIRAGGMQVDGSITLGRAPLASSDGTAAVTSFSGNTAGTLGNRAMSGAWGGRFYGPNRAAGGSVAQRTEFPTSAAGTFNANTVGGTGPGMSILGSFGAHRQ